MRWPAGDEQERVFINLTEADLEESRRDVWGLTENVSMSPVFDSAGSRLLSPALCRTHREFTTRSLHYSTVLEVSRLTLRRHNAPGPPASRRRHASSFARAGLLRVIGRHGGEETLHTHEETQSDVETQNVAALRFKDALTESSVSGELLVDLSHPLDVQSTGLGVVHHGFGIIHPDHAAGGALHVLRSVPGVIDELGWKISEDR